MFQDFTAATNPLDGPPRLTALRDWMEERNLAAYLVPRADVHQGEYVAPCDEKLAWLTGFTGSAGFAAVTMDQAGVFIDGRYRVQVQTQVALDVFTPVPSPEIKLVAWLCERLGPGDTVAANPWLYTKDALERLEKGLEKKGITLRRLAEDPFDVIWADRPAKPLGAVQVQPLDLAGQSHAEKRAELAEALKDKGREAVVLTLPDSISWLLNIRGTDIPRNPVVQSFAILHASGAMQLFADHPNLPELAEHLGPDITVEPSAQFETALQSLSGRVQVDPKSAPDAVRTTLGATNAIDWEADPCALPKARKNDAELAGSRAAHLRDGVALASHLYWLSQNAPGGTLTEIDVVTHLEECRRKDPLLRDISFETISGTGAHGAIVHYRVTEETNATITPGDLLLIDSGGQYQDGTTDITRTIATGPVTAEQKAAFTRVLQGMIDISMLRWPVGMAGRDLDAIARVALWRAGQDFNHGTGHGVGSFLSVHEGPQGLSRRSEVPLEPGMILSNEPGYYREGAFGIRIENLIAVQEAPALPGGDDRPMLQFETLTFAPIDRALIDASLLTGPQCDWLNSYHAQVLEKVGGSLSPDALEWLTQACAPLSQGMT